MWLILLATPIVALIILGIWIHFSRPHLPGPPRGQALKDLDQYRQHVSTRLEIQPALSYQAQAFMHNVKKYGLSHESEGLVVTADPEVIKQIMMNKQHSDLRSFFYKASGWVLYGEQLFPRAAVAISLGTGMDGVLNMEGATWKRHSRVLRPVFQRRVFNPFTQTMHDEVKRALSGWSEENNLLEAMRVITNRFLLQWGFGLNPDHALSKELTKSLLAYSRMVATFTTPVHKAFFNWLKMAAESKKLKGIVEKIIAVKATPAASELFLKRPDDSPQFLSAMLEEGFTLREIYRAVNHVHGAFKALAFVFTAMLFELDQHPDMLEEIKAELARVVPAGSIPTQESWEQAEHSQRFIKEVLRHHVVTFAGARKLGEPMDIGGKTMPAGTEVAVLLHAVHHHPDFWEEPETFNPDRFKTKPKEFTYLPFFEGQRQCAGRQLAELQLLVALHAFVTTARVKVGVDELVMKSTMYAAYEHAIPFSVQLY